jgi:hypothetical protein
VSFLCKFDDKKKKDFYFLYIFRPKKDKIRRASQFPESAPDRSGI